VCASNLEVGWPRYRRKKSRACRVIDQVEVGMIILAFPLILPVHYSLFYAFFEVADAKMSGMYH
jgi:hypothetical protein